MVGMRITPHHETSLSTWALLTDMGEEGDAADVDDTRNMEVALTEEQEGRPQVQAGHLPATQQPLKNTKEAVKGKKTDFCCPVTDFRRTLILSYFLHYR